MRQVIQIEVCIQVGLAQRKQITLAHELLGPEANIGRLTQRTCLLSHRCWVRVSYIQMPCRAMRCVAGCLVNKALVTWRVNANERDLSLIEVGG